MVLLRGLNYDYTGEQSTKLTEATPAGSTMLKVVSADGFAVADYLVIDPGNDNAEILKVSAVTASLKLTTDAAAFPHPRDSELYRLPYNQMRFYECATATGTYVEIASSTAEMKYDDNYTEYDDTTGNTDYYFKRTFYNATTAVESDIELSNYWQSDDEKLYITPEELRTFLGFDPIDYPGPEDMRSFIKIAQMKVNLDMDTTSINVLFIATMYLSKHYVLKALATRSVSKGYVQVMAEGRTITKAYQEFVLAAENIFQEYKEFILQQNRREATSTNFMNDTTQIDSLTRQNMIDILTGATNAEDMQSGYRFNYYDRSRLR